jgi:hypothetical protein
VAHAVAHAVLPVDCDHEERQVGGIRAISHLYTYGVNLHSRMGFESQTHHSVLSSMRDTHPLADLAGVAFGVLWPRLDCSMEERAKHAPIVLRLPLGVFCIVVLCDRMECQR